MAKAPSLKQFDIKTIQTEATKSAQRVLNAGVGVTDLAVGALRGYAAGAQKRFTAAQKAAQQSVSTFDPKTGRAAIEKRVAELRSEAIAVPGRVQDTVDLGVTTATAAYGDLVKRGQTLVGRIRRQQSTREAVAAAETTVSKAKATQTQATGAAKTAKKSATTSTAKKRTAAKSSAKGTRTAAKKSVSAGSRALADAAKKVGD
jgi:hypothetical protein